MSWLNFYMIKMDLLFKHFFNIKFMQDKKKLCTHRLYESKGIWKLSQNIQFELPICIYKKNHTVAMDVWRGISKSLICIIKYKCGYW